MNPELLSYQNNYFKIHRKITTHEHRHNTPQQDTGKLNPVIFKKNDKRLPLKLTTGIQVGLIFENQLVRFITLTK